MRGVRAVGGAGRTRTAPLTLRPTSRPSSMPSRRLRPAASCALPVHVPYRRPPSRSPLSPPAFLPPSLSLSFPPTALSSHRPFLPPSSFPPPFPPRLLPPASRRSPILGGGSGRRALVPVVTTPPHASTHPRLPTPSLALNVPGEARAGGHLRLRAPGGPPDDRRPGGCVGGADGVPRRRRAVLLQPRPRIRSQSASQAPAGVPRERGWVWMVVAGWAGTHTSLPRTTPSNP